MAFSQSPLRSLALAGQSAKRLQLGLAVVGLLCLWGCSAGNSNGGGGGGKPSYTIGGSVSGLTASGLVLQDNGIDNLTISADGPFTFNSIVPSGDAYNVTVLTQPSNPAQSCTVASGSGTASGNVSNIQVTCTSLPMTNVWTWMGGPNFANQTGIYGTKGAAASGNVPGSRDSSMTWRDSTGNVWLFGGFGVGSTNLNGYFNDLWKYSSGTWTWESGSDAINQNGAYGVKGTADSSNLPGGRSEAVTWIDASGNLWLFGGYGYDSAGNVGDLNDLWEYSAGQWTWISGSNVAGQSGFYGTRGTAAPSNIPGARHHSVSWIDLVGNLWLFGGVGYDSHASVSPLNDLWMYSAGQWTWQGGSSTINASGIYGTKGTSSSTNVPGARSAGVAWTDASGNFWLFGGGGWDSAGTLGYLNDLWKFNGSDWTWVSGSNLANQSPVYGTEGNPDPANVPGGRIQAVGWTDVAGTFWLFSGHGLANHEGQLNDLWKYSAGQWTWVSGSNDIAQAGDYGSLGVPASSNVPGARQASVVWIDSAGNFWIFGGYGEDSQDLQGELNDLWEYQP